MVSASGISQSMDPHPAHRALRRRQRRNQSILCGQGRLPRRLARSMEARHRLAPRPGLNLHHQDPAGRAGQGLPFLPVPEDGRTETRHLTDGATDGHVAKGDGRAHVRTQHNDPGAAPIKTRRCVSINRTGALPGRDRAQVRLHRSPGGDLRDLACIPHPKTTTTPRTLRALRAQGNH